MKFQLFGRLRDGEDNNTGQRNTEPGESGGLQQGSSPSMGGGLDNIVEKMFSQGYSQDEIKQELQGQYPPEDIDRAVNNAVAATATQDARSGPQPMTPYQGDQDAVSPVDEGFSPQESQPQNDNMNDDFNQPEPQQEPLPPVTQEGGQGQPAPAEPSSDVEALVETIVAENFDRVEQEFENVYTEIDEIREELEEMEQRVHDLEVRDDEDQTEFIQKVDEMEEHIDSYQSRIGGLEKAFQQVLPSLVDNVRDLTDLVQEIKNERGIQTEKDVSSDDIDDIDMEDWD